jgi:2-polyprenyl-3-methyl-5-hydroxy-6-metoxy-1,4-benzoquinol methylase
MKNLLKKLIKSGGQQTPTEKLLINELIKELVGEPEKLILNIGAGKSMVIEESLAAAKCRFAVDRLDICETNINKPYFRKSFKCSIESCLEITSATYDIAFANYVFEHIDNLKSTASEVRRILKPSGLLVLTIPNPQAIEFQIAKRTPLSFHQVVRGEKIDDTGEAFETFYAYKTLEEFIEIFKNNGFKLEKYYYRSFIYGYLYRFPFISVLARLYDYIINQLKLKTLSGQTCLVFKRND